MATIIDIIINSTIGSILSNIESDSTSEFFNIEESKEKLSEVLTDIEIIKKLGFDRTTKNYINSEPQILFVSEYKVDDKQAGVLLVFEKFFESTHYEIFKRNIFSTNSEFERILFIDSKNLEDERKNYISYIKDILGFSNMDENNIFIYHDNELKSDRIYEYKIRATFVPRIVDEIDYDSILESKDLLKTIQLVTSTANIFNFSTFSLGSDEQAWIISLLNEKLMFFGKLAKEPLRNFINVGDVILVPSSVEDVMKIINDSVILFGVKNTVSRLIGLIGELDKSIKKIILESIDETTLSFSVDNIKDALLKEYPGIDFKSELVSSILNRSGTKLLNSVANFSFLFNFINDMVNVLVIAQEGPLAQVNEIAVLPIQQEPIVSALQQSATVSTTQQVTATNTQQTTAVSPQTREVIRL